MFSAVGYSQITPDSGNIETKTESTNYLVLKSKSGKKDIYLKENSAITVYLNENEQFKGNFKYINDTTISINNVSINLNKILKVNTIDPTRTKGLGAFFLVASAAAFTGSIFAFGKALSSNDVSQFFTSAALGVMSGALGVILIFPAIIQFGKSAPTYYNKENWQFKTTQIVK
jgi:hypothetical protein